MNEEFRARRGCVGWDWPDDLHEVGGHLDHGDRITDLWLGLCWTVHDFGLVWAVG